jgi:hypothetical protein
MPFNINQLRTYANANDRVGYWNYLGQYDSYGRLAVGVATNETTSGYVANKYFENVYQDRFGFLPTPDLMRTIGTGLMQRDLAQREQAILNNNSNGLNLTPEIIANYHRDEFIARTNGQIGYEGWTAWAPLRDSLQTGDQSRANTIWEAMLQDDFFKNVTLGTSIGPFGSPFEAFPGSNPAMTLAEYSSWISRVGPAYIRGSISDADSISIRNTERINGWSRAADGKWSREELTDQSYDQLGTFTGITAIKTASAAEAVDLNYERQQRIIHYGSNATHRADAPDTIYLKDGDIIQIDKSGFGTKIAQYDGGNDDNTYSIKASYFDSSGRLSKTELLMDDGRSREVLLDPLDIRPELTRTTEYAPDGRVIGVTREYDSYSFWQTNHAVKHNHVALFDDDALNALSRQIERSAFHGSAVPSSTPAPFSYEPQFASVYDYTLLGGAGIDAFAFNTAGFRH